MKYIFKISGCLVGQTASEGKKKGDLKEFSMGHLQGVTPTYQSNATANLSPKGRRGPWPKGGTRFPPLEQKFPRGLKSLIQTWGDLDCQSVS